MKKIKSWEDVFKLRAEIFNRLLTRCGLYWDQMENTITPVVEITAPTLLESITANKKYIAQLHSNRLTCEEKDIWFLDWQLEISYAELEMLVNKRRWQLIEKKRERDKKAGKPVQNTKEQVSLEAIRAIPITDILAITPNKPIPCLWHKEKTPSMRLHPTKNFVKCFGCGKHASIIDVYMVQNDCDVKEAVHNLSRLVV